MRVIQIGLGAGGNHRLSCRESASTVRSAPRARPHRPHSGDDDANDMMITRKGTTMARTAAGDNGSQPVKLWSWPKVVFLYPTLIAAIAAGIGSTLWSGGATTWGTLFLIVFFVNILIMAFDFPRTASLNLFLVVIVVILAAVLVNQHLVVFLPFLRNLTDGIAPQANRQFYFLIAGSLAFVYLVALIIDFRFDYWLVQPNELIHRQGLLGNVSRYPAPGLELQKEITDVFEYFLFASGRLVIQPTRGPAIVLENVFRVNEKERRIRALLDALNVEITTQDRVVTNY